MNNKRTVFRLLGYLAEHKLLFFLVLILTVASNALALVGPMLSGYAIDAIEPGVGAVMFEKVFLYCGLMLVIYAISAALSYALSALMIHLSQKVVYRMRKDVFDHLLDLPVGYFDKLQAGDIISRISYDIDTVNSSLSSDVIQVATTIITVLGSFFSMLYLSPSLLLVFLVTVPITIIFTYYKTKRIRPLFKARSRKLGELNGFVEEIISGQKTVKAYGRELFMIDRFDGKNKEAVDSYYEAEYYGSMIGPSVNFINNLSLALISTGGALLYLFGNISLGKVSSFILYSRKFSGPISELANIVSELQSAIAAAERVFAVIDEPAEPEDRPGAADLSDVRGDVKIDGLSFGYTPDIDVITDLSIDIKSGDLVAIVGHTGAGKTTLVNLLMRFYDTERGRITIDGSDIRDITRESLRRSFTMVLQDTWLFGGTIRENIAYGCADSSMDDVIDAAKAAGLHDYIVSLPDGYETQLSDDGVNLSKGQKQLLTIARAMLCRSSILILDEATSNVDTKTERQIQDAMYKLMEGRTCFVIAHRLSTIENADLILVIDEGQVIEKGTHRQLLDKKGAYSEMYYSQFE